MGGLPEPLGVAFSEGPGLPRDSGALGSTICSGSRPGALAAVAWQFRPARLFVLRSCLDRPAASFAQVPDWQGPGPRSVVVGLVKSKHPSVQVFRGEGGGLNPDASG